MHVSIFLVHLGLFAAFPRSFRRKKIRGLLQKAKHISINNGEWLYASFITLLVRSFLSFSYR